MPAPLNDNNSNQNLAPDLRRPPLDPYEHDDYQYVPLDNGLPSLRYDWRWFSAEPNLPRAAPPAEVPASFRRVAEYHAALQAEEEPGQSHQPSSDISNDPTAINYQNESGTAHRDFRSEYEDLLREIQERPADISQRTVRTLRFLQSQARWQSRDLSDGEREGLAVTNHNENENEHWDGINYPIVYPPAPDDAMSFAPNDDQEHRRRSRPTGASSGSNGNAALRTTTSRFAPAFRPEEEEDQLDAVRAMWNRRAQNTSSPFSPPHSSELSPAHLSPTLRPQEYIDDSRRAKRRKIESDRVAPSFKGFRYGHYGQVEPGDLKMEIVSCDGGLYSESASFGYENILKNDGSVYCTKSSRCNIVLRHQGATPFSLKELVIKAPGSGNYSSPVREGMVFVSMSHDEALTRTAQYQIQYAARPRARGSNSRELRPLAPVITIHRNEDGTLVTRTSSRNRRLYSLNDGNDWDEEATMAQIPPAFEMETSPLNVTTACSDDESDDDPPPSRFNRRTPNRIGALPFESESSDESPSANDEYGLDDAWAPASRRRGTRDMTLAQAVDADQHATQEAIRAVSGNNVELMPPHAKFYIEKQKSKCTIHFDPPISGRYILLKMWSPNRELSNIDIQTVIAKGFAGPRYFPSVELR